MSSHPTAGHEIPDAPLCPLCEQGVRRIFRCARGEHWIILCDECHSVWLDPRHLELEDLLVPEGPRQWVPGARCELIGDGAGWASEEEAREFLEGFAEGREDGPAAIPGGEGPGP